MVFYKLFNVIVFFFGNTHNYRIHFEYNVTTKYIIYNNRIIGIRTYMYHSLTNNIIYKIEYKNTDLYFYITKQTQDE